MWNHRKYISVILCLVLLLITVSGCFRITADELYSLPQASKKYLKLREQINKVLSSGAEYSPPTAGPNRQSVQLKDIDGDGQNEAIAFFKTTEDKPLKIYIMKETDGAYQTADVIEGDGTAIESIRYEDMDADGVPELVIGWQMSATLRHMTIYSIREYQHVLLANSDYTALVVNDMNDDGNMDVIALRLPSSDFPGEAEMFSLRSNGEIDRNIALLSKGIESIKRVFKGKLSDDTPAIFVEGGYTGEKVVTDIFALRYNAFVNVSASSENGISEDTLRAYAIYSTDINNDGIVEVPSPKLLVSSPDTKYYVIDWYAYNEHGNKNVVFSTYHNIQDEWYLILPDDWENKITVRRDDTVSGERTLIFSYINAEEKSPEDFLKIYTLSGDNKEDRVKILGRFELHVHGDKIFAAEILTTDVDMSISRQLIKDNFKLLYSDWVTGVT